MILLVRNVYQRALKPGSSPTLNYSNKWLIHPLTRAVLTSFCAALILHLNQSNE
jgi:hypothetical protein